MTVVKALFWGSVGALAWTHVGYPVAAALGARLRTRRVHARDELPTVAAVVAAHDEETVIERRLENLLEQDYPPELIEIVVASDASTDRTDALVDEIAAREPRVRLLRCARGGKVAAQNRAVRETTGEILAFSDAKRPVGAGRAAEARSHLRRSRGRVRRRRPRLRAADGTNREGTYWKYEHWLRQNESRLGSITGGIGPIYAVRREDYVEVDPRFGHDLAFPYLMVQRGRRAVYDPDALAYEKPSRDLEDEYRRKVRMFEHCWLIVLRGGMLRRLGPLVPRRDRLAPAPALRERRAAPGRCSGRTSLLVRRGGRLPGRARRPARAARRRGRAQGIARYYVLVTWATVAALANYLRRGVPPTWAPAEGTR